MGNGTKDGLVAATKVADTHKKEVLAKAKTPLKTVD